MKYWHISLCVALGACSSGWSGDGPDGEAANTSGTCVEPDLKAIRAYVSGLETACDHFSTSFVEQNAGFIEVPVDAMPTPFQNI